MRKLTILAGALLLIPTVSQAASLEDLLVEKGVITKSEARASMHGGGAKVYWNDGTRLDFPDKGFTAQINTGLQTRYEFTDNENAQNTSSFEVHRARLAVSGSAMHNEFEYMVESDLGASDDPTGGGPQLMDAWLQWNVCDSASVRMGQFKAFGGRQENTHYSSLQFADRSAVSETFTLGRHQGAQVGFDLNDDWSLSGGIYNGESTGEGQNAAAVDTNHTLEVSLRGNLMGDMNPYEEGDIGRTDEAAVNVGATYSFSDADLGGIDNEEIQRFAFDASVKSNGFSLHGEFFWADMDNADTDDVGFYAQAGYFFADDMEVAARYGLTSCDDGKLSALPGANNVCGAGTDDVNEVAVSLNHYWWDHHLKAQLGWSYMDTDPVVGDSTDQNRITFQLSAYV